MSFLGNLSLTDAGHLALLKSNELGTGVQLKEFGFSTVAYDLNDTSLINTDITEWYRADIDSHAIINNDTIKLICSIEAPNATSATATVAIYLVDGTLFALAQPSFPTPAQQKQLFDIQIGYANIGQSMDFTYVPDTDKAKIDGDATRTFNVATATGDAHAVNLALLMAQIVPQGGVIMWSGAIANIPPQWALCDGTNGTPNLVGRFIFGTNVELDIGNMGGSKDAIAVAHTHTQNSHTHTLNHDHPNVTTSSAGNHYHGSGWGEIGHYGSRHGIYSWSAGIGSHSTDWDNAEHKTSTNGSHTHTLNVPNFTGNTGGATPTVNSAGESGTDKNLPPYMKLAYIMKI
ncbi:MAG: hypothetical protein GQ474_01180 [Sulfurimonas sp.]|nr:hypothetical protein [Sulfurimonas sp.]